MPRSPPAETQRALRRDEHDVRVARVDHDLADVLGRGQADLGPGLARVHGLVDAVAEVGAALAGVLTRAQPDHVGVFRIHDHAERQSANVTVRG